MKFPKLLLSILAAVVLATAGFGQTAVLRGSTVGAGSTGGAAISTMTGSIGLRNRLVNGDMRIDQANAGVALSVTSGSTFYSVDKWRGIGTPAAGVFSLQRLAATPPAGFTNYLRVLVTTADAAPAAGAAYVMGQYVEGLYCQDLQFGIAANGQSVTVGFYCRSSLTGTFSGSIANGVTNRSYPFTFVISAANTWTFNSVTVPVDTTGTWNVDNTIGLKLWFDQGSGANLRSTANTWQAGNFSGVTGTVSLLATNGATFDLTGAQLEPGTVSTPYEQTAFADMLQRCQREYCKSFLLGTVPVQNAGTNTGETQWPAVTAGATSSYISVSFPVTMRVAPAIVTMNPAAANAQARDLIAGVDCSAIGAANQTERGFRISSTSNAATSAGNLLGFHWTADSRL